LLERVSFGCGSIAEAAGESTAERKGAAYREDP